MSAPTVKCSQCGGTTFTSGFLGGAGQHERGTYERWYEGDLEIGVFGGVKRPSSRARFQVVAHRCQQCDHVELFVGEPD